MSDEQYCALAVSVGGLIGTIAGAMVYLLR